MRIKGSIINWTYESTSARRLDSFPQVQKCRQERWSKSLSLTDRASIHNYTQGTHLDNLPTRDTWCSLFNDSSQSRHVVLTRLLRRTRLVIRQVACLLLARANSVGSGKYVRWRLRSLGSAPCSTCIYLPSNMFSLDLTTYAAMRYLYT